MQGFTQLRMSVRGTPTTLATHPMATVLSLLADAVGGLPQGLPPPWRSAVRAAVPVNAQDVLRPMFPGGTCIVPDCLAAAGALLAGTAQEQFEYIADASPAVLAEQLAADFGGAVPAVWEPVLRAPERWIGRYVEVLRALWTDFQPVWQRAGALIDRETERVGAAVLRGALELVLTRVSPRCRYADGVLYVQDTLASAYVQQERPLVLVPTISGADASVFSFDRPDLVWIGYPLPGLGRLWANAPSPPPAEDALTLLLGAARAAILRYAAAGTTMGTIATVAGCSRATATYHCAQLEASGLVLRQRDGSQVRVRRTVRGDELIDLLS
jgi:hypothetical protein